MLHTSLLEYYKTNEALITIHNYSLKDIERMYPFERDIYINLNIQRRQAESANATHTE